MGTFINADTSPTDPLASNPYLEDDWGIVRGVTLISLDFSNELTLPISGAIPFGTVLGNLVNGGADATTSGGALGTLPAEAGGMLKTLGAATGGGYPFINLPAAANLAAGVTRSLEILWVKLPAAGSIGAGAILGMFGSGTGSGASLQRHAYLQGDGAGAPQNLVYRVRGTAANIDATLTGAALTAIRDGDLHQLAYSIEVAGGVGTVKAYVDGSVVVTVSGAMAAFNTPGGTPTVLAAPGAAAFINATTAALDYRVGRYSLHNLSARPDLEFTDLITRDQEAADGYLDANA